MVEEKHELRSKSVEDFLKKVYLLEQQVSPVPTSMLANELGFAAPSVTDMIKRLSAPGDSPQTVPLLEYKPYHGIRLTDTGRKIALEVIRHHRLLELYLVRALGYSWDEVHEEAERLEHFISEKFEARIAAALGNPVIDPHGDPIPTLDGTIAVPSNHPLLSEMSIGQHGAVTRIADQSPEVLRYFKDLGLTPGASLRLTYRSPLNDTISLCVNDQHTYTIGMQVASKVFVHID